MELLAEVLPIVIDVLLIVLITVSIILIIKCIYIIDKAKAIILNVEDKINSFNSIFSIIKLINDKISFITERCVGVVDNLITKVFHRFEDASEEEFDDKGDKKRKEEYNE